MPVAVPRDLRARAPDAVCIAQFHANDRHRFPVAQRRGHMKVPQRPGDAQSIPSYRDGGHPCQPH